MPRARAENFPRADFAIEGAGDAVEGHHSSPSS
jgi:hypothetical protein